MSIYNEARFLKESVGSVLGQSFGDFEFIILDDGSTDGSADLVREFADPRIRLIVRDRNWGLTSSLNFGLRECGGRYIARMDADDIAEPPRLEKQVDFLERRLNIGALGSARLLIDELGQVVGRSSPPANDLAIRWKCLLGNPFGHPTVMLRREVLKRHRLQYDRSFRTAQDYEFWSRLLRVTCGANLPEPLLRYRLRKGSSRTDKSQQLASHDRIAALAIRRLLPGTELRDDQVRELRGRFGGYSVRDATMNPTDPVWQRLYLSLFDAFQSAYGYEPSLMPLRWLVRWNVTQAAA